MCDCCLVVYMYSLMQCNNLRSFSWKCLIARKLLKRIHENPDEPLSEVGEEGREGVGFGRVMCSGCSLPLS